MRRRLLVACVTLLATGLGCNQGAEPPAVTLGNGGSTSPSAPASRPAGAPANPGATAVATPTQKTTTDTPAPVVNISPGLAPDAIVHRFLDALKIGDKDVAAHLLTNKARTETAKHDLTVQPPGTPDAKYQVGRVEFVNPTKDGAYVHSVWVEPGEAGAAEKVEIVWVLRKQTDGWRIAGMATEISPNDPPLFLNFEDPADMLRKAEAAAAQPATQPGATQAGPTQSAGGQPAGGQPTAQQPAARQPTAGQPNRGQPAASTAQRPTNPVRSGRQAAPATNGLRQPSATRPPTQPAPRYQPPVRR